MTPHALLRIILRSFFPTQGLADPMSHEKTLSTLPSRMAQLLEAMITDPRVRGSSPKHDQTFTQSEESRHHSVGIPGVGIARCGHIERKDQDTALKV